MKKVIFLFGILTVFSCSTAVQPKPVRQTAEQMEKTEFEMLMKQDSINKHQTAAESLDVLLNESPTDNRVSLIIKNNSNCNIILRFAGDKFYNLPVLKNNKNFIVIDKGYYTLGANLCNSRYSSSKTFTDSVTMTLSER